MACVLGGSLMCSCLLPVAHAASYPYQPPHLMAVAEAAVMLEQHGGTATLDAATDQHLQAVKQDIDCHLGQRDAWLQQQHRQWLEQLQVLNQPT